MSDETPDNDAAPSPAAETPPTPEAQAPATPEATPAPEAQAAAAPAPAPEAPSPATATAPSAAAAATQPEMAAAAPPPAQPAAVPVAEPAAAAPSSSSHVAVPKWVLATVAAIVGAAVMFGIGYAVGDGSNSNDNSASIGTPFNPNGGNQQGNGNQQTPNLPGQGNGNQNGGGNQQTPQSPNQSASGAFLGVATQQTNDGLEILQVVSGSAADDAGLRVGDVIVAFDGNDVTTPAQLANAVGNLDPGDKVDIEYERDGNSRTATVELGSRSATNSN